MRDVLFNQILNRFYAKGKFKFYFLIFLSFIAGLFEYMGLILIFQFVLFLINPNTKYCSDIILFFNNNFNIYDFNKISLMLGLSVVSIYVFKNIYMLIFTAFNNKILQDLSSEITLKTLKNILFQDFLVVKSINSEDKLNLISKITIVVWQYCYKYINLIINLIIAFLLLVYLFIKFLIPALCATLFIVVLAFVEYKYLKTHSKYQNENFSNCFNEINSLFIKIITSFKEIKLNNQQEYFINKAKERFVDYSKLNVDRNFCDVFHIYFTEISVMLAFALVLGVLFYTTNFDNQLLMTSICSICVIILRLTPLINRAQSCLYSINANRKVAQELLEFDNKFTKNCNYSMIYEKLPFNRDIELKNVDFSYDKNLGLQNINLKINKGDFIGIIGKSGCYKTTLSLIILGLIKPQKGEIYIDGNKLEEIDYKKWQNNIAILTQDFDFLYDNLDEIIEKYSKKLDLNTNSKVSELSQGEKQRLAFANILAKDKEILILDEITSSCDVLSEDKINDILLDLKGKKTIIAIAHRLNILKYSNKIIYMDEGKIIDIGTFSELSEKYDEFKNIIKLSEFKID